MTHRLFVYGTLKQGFPNAHVNQGRPVPGRFVTVERWPLYLVTEHQVPWLLPLPGEGEPVIGEVYEVDDEALARMDRLERIDQPEDWYSRREIEVRDADRPDAPVLRVWVYFGSESRWRRGPVHGGPFPEYRTEMALRYRSEPHDQAVAGDGPAGPPAAR